MSKQKDLFDLLSKPELKGNLGILLDWMYEHLPGSFDNRNKLDYRGRPFRTPDDQFYQFTSRAAKEGRLEVLDWIKDRHPEWLDARTDGLRKVVIHDAAAEGRTDVLDWAKKNKPELLTVKSGFGDNLFLSLFHHHGKLSDVFAESPYGQNDAAVEIAGKRKAISVKLLDWVLEEMPELLESLVYCFAENDYTAHRLSWIQENHPQSLKGLNLTGRTQMHPEVKDFFNALGNVRGSAIRPTVSPTGDGAQGPA